MLTLPGPIVSVDWLHAHLDRPELRMPLVASQVVGLILIRYVLRVEPLASLPPDQLVATYAPTIQRYLSDPLP